jgi:hypothetical protein
MSAPSAPAGPAPRAECPLDAARSRRASAPRPAARLASRRRAIGLHQPLPAPGRPAPAPAAGKVLAPILSTRGRSVRRNRLLESLTMTTGRAPGQAGNTSDPFTGGENRLALT